MAIALLGFNYQSAPLPVRERLALDEAAIQHALTMIAQGEFSRLDELLIIATCNRLEFYGVVADKAGCFQALAQVVTMATAVPETDFAGYAYHHLDEQAIDHLLCVVSGLDSLILGETQILGQTAKAYDRALMAGSCGSLLSGLFQRAIHAGKRVQHETHIGQAAASVPAAAAILARERLGGLAGRSVLVIGAGQTGELAARALVSQGATTIRVMNRTYERALAVAQRLDGTAHSFDDLIPALTDADVVITSVGAAQPILSEAQVQAALDRRTDRPLLIIDLGMPRNVAPGAGSLPGVRLVELDHLRSVADQGLVARQAAIPAAEHILAEEKAAIIAWLAALSVQNTVADLRAHAEDIRQAELTKALRRLGPLSERERSVLEAMTQGIVNKILHHPTVRLKAQARDGHALEYAQVLRQLFALAQTDET